MKNKVLVIVGPTATNKTSLAIKLANDLSGEIINADAYQTYKELNIGVNKPTKEQLAKAKFYLVDELSVFDEWDIAKFQKKAYQLIQRIIDNNKLPIICGGSSLYIDALVKNYKLDTLSKRSNEFDSLDVNELYQRLAAIDPIVANKNKNNHKRLARALEIYSNSSDINPMKQTNESKYDFKIILTNTKDRESLYCKINQRVDQMFKEGWVNEVKQLSKISNIDKTNGFKAIGYSEILDAIKNNRQPNIDKIKQATRRYAKRQITWIKNHYQNSLVYTQDNYDDILKNIKLWIK